MPVTLTGLHSHYPWRDLHIIKVVRDVDDDGRVLQCLRLQWTYGEGWVVDKCNINSDDHVLRAVPMVVTCMIRECSGAKVMEGRVVDDVTSGGVNIVLQK